MQDSGMLTNSKFSYVNNTNAHNATIPLLQAIEAANLLPFPGEKEKVKRAYERVAKLGTPENQAQYNQDLKDIEDQATGVLSKKIIDLVRKGIFAPLAAMAAVPVFNAIASAKERIQVAHEEKIEAANDNSPNADKKSPVISKAKSRRLEKINAEIDNDPRTKQYLGQGMEARRIVMLYWIDDLKTKDGMTTQEAYNNLLQTVLTAEQKMPYRMQEAFYSSMAIKGVRSCLNNPTCASVTLALMSKVGLDIGKITTEAHDKTMRDYLSGGLERFHKEGGNIVLDKQKTQSNAGHGVAMPDPDEDPN